MGPVARELRPALDLEAATHVSAVEARERDKQLTAFLAWSRQLCPVDAQQICSTLEPGAAAPPPARLLVRLAKTYAQHLYDTGRSSSYFKSLLLALQDRAPELRGGPLRPAWKTLTAWQKTDTRKPTVPMPFTVFVAMFVAAVLFGQHDFACVLLLAWHAALRPGEMLAVARGHLSFPEDRLDRRAVLFVAIPIHKTSAHEGVGLQHATIRDPDVVRFLSRRLGARPRHGLVFPGSDDALAKQFAYTRDALGLPGGQGTGFTPRSLRTGRATDLYLNGVAPSDISWLLRHTSEKTRAHYIQEAGCALALAALSLPARLLLNTLAPAYLPVLRAPAAARNHDARVERPPARRPFQPVQFDSLD
jgi:integrase